MATNPIHARMSESLDTMLVKVIEEGVTALDADGQAVQLTPSAAMIREIRTRLKDLGVTQQATVGSPAARLAQAMKGRNLKYPSLPPVDTDGEDLAQGVA